MIKLNNYIFHRNYGDTTVVYNTYMQTFYHFNDTVGIVLDYLREGIQPNDIVAQLKVRYPASSSEASAYVSEVIDMLLKEKIVFDTLSKNATLEERCVFDISENNNLFSILFETTYRCNEKCKHCYVCDSSENELTIDEIRKVFSDLRSLNVMNIILSGGDVFCRKDFLDIFSLAIEFGFAVDIYTNGVLCDDSKVVEIARRHPRSIHFSIYSLDPQKHDEFTQIPNSFAKTIAVAKKFRDLGVAVNFKTILLKMNCDELSAMIDFARDFGATIQIGTVLRQKQDGSLSPLALRVEDEVYGEIIPVISEKLNRSKEDEIQGRNLDSKICGAGFTSLTINPYGKVFPCGSLDIEVGDIRKSSIIDIWENSQELKRWKEETWRAVEKCNKCEKATVCAYCPGIALQRNNTPFLQYDDACILTDATIKYINSKGGGQHAE